MQDRTKPSDPLFSNILGLLDQERVRAAERAYDMAMEDIRYRMLRDATAKPNQLVLEVYGARMLYEHEMFELDVRMSKPTEDGPRQQFFEVRVPARWVGNSTRLLRALRDAFMSLAHELSRPSASGPERELGLAMGPMLMQPSRHQTDWRPFEPTWEPLTPIELGHGVAMKPMRLVFLSFVHEVFRERHGTFRLEVITRDRDADTPLRLTFQTGVRDDDPLRHAVEELLLHELAELTTIDGVRDDPHKYDIARRAMFNVPLSAEAVSPPRMPALYTLPFFGDKPESPKRKP